MYERILVPTDGSDAAASGLTYALEIASEHGATIHLLNVANTNKPSNVRLEGDVLDVLVREGRQIVDGAAERVRDRGVPVVADVLQGDPSETIVEYADDQNVDVVVMPTQGRRGLKRYLLGSVTERVINTADVPVIALNPEEGPMAYPPRDILVPTDGSRGGDLAVERGIDIARATAGQLHLLHVVETGALGPDVRSALKEEELTERANEIVATAEEQCETADLDSVTRTIEYGEPFRVIRNYITDNDIGLAVLGTHGETDFSRYVMGGVSAKIVRTSPAPVVWVRAPDTNAG